MYTINHTLEPINFERMPVSRLLTPKISIPEHPYDPGFDEYMALSPLDRDLARQEARLSAPIYGQPSAVGYLFEQVAKENAELVDEQIFEIQPVRALSLVEAVKNELHNLWLKGSPAGHNTQVNCAPIEGSKIEAIQIGKHVITVVQRLSTDPELDGFLQTYLGSADIAVDGHKSKEMAQQHVNAIAELSDEIYLSGKHFIDTVRGLQKLTI